MKNLRRLLLCFSICMLSLSTQNVSAGGTLDKIVSTKQINFGYRLDTPPFAYYKNGRPQGYSVELCSLLMGAVFLVSDIDGVTGVFTEVSAQERFDKLRAGEIDVLCGATTATLTRRETMSFTIPIYSTGIAVLIGENSSSKVRKLFASGGPADHSREERSQLVENVRIGVRNGTTAETWVNDTFEGTNGAYSMTKFADHSVGVAAARAGEIDVYIADKAILHEQMKRLNFPTDVTLSERAYTHEPYALAIPRADEDLRLMLDKALSYLFRTGKVLRIHEKYFGPATDEVKQFYLMNELPE